MIYILACDVADLPEPSEPSPQPSPEQISNFYVRLGMAIAAWQFVDANLCHVYASAIGSLNYEALTASFHVPINFRARLDMTDEAVKRSRISNDLIDEWAKLYAKLRKKSSRRNALTHGTVVFQPSQQKKDRQLFIAPSISDLTRSPRGLDLDTAIYQAHIDDMIQAFDALNTELFLFFQKLPPALRPLAASP